jgi:putative heme-binding domain-containing protein
VLIAQQLRAQSTNSGPNGSPVTSHSREEYRKFALLREGDSVRGKQLFADSQKTLCSNCHSTDGTASKAGPDLLAVGDKFGRRDIIDSILTPSATIAVGYSTTTIENRQGDVYSGVIKEATDAAVELMGADGKRARIPTAEITERLTSDVSFMPEGLIAGLTLQEFTDLIEYLVSLKQPTNTERVHHGMPAEILSTIKPVDLRPIHDETFHFDHPVWFGPIPGRTNSFLTVEHETGYIWRLDTGATAPIKTLFVELGHFLVGTRGLLGIAFHPRFAENRKYYYAKHLAENGKFATHIFEREAAPDLKSDSGKPSRLILKLDAATNVHYGGGLQFGPDGFFYIGMGDTGPQEDPQGHGQDGHLLLGKMLRIDVDHVAPGQAYSIPSDNPFPHRADIRPEIWALGFREPWRFSFDPLTGDLWVGDVGQDRYEEVDIVQPGRNYGWNVYEGFEPFSNRYRQEKIEFVPPVFAYPRKLGVSVTGGYVYRADAKSSFYGVYIFGDYQSQRLWGLTQENGTLKLVRQIGSAPQRIVSFGRGLNGELYVVGYEGTIYSMDFSHAVFE